MRRRGDLLDHEQAGQVLSPETCERLERLEAERLVEAARPLDVGDAERDEADALLHAYWPLVRPSGLGHGASNRRKRLSAFARTS